MRTTQTLPVQWGESQPATIPIYRCEDFDRDCHHVGMGANHYTGEQQCCCGSRMIHVADLLPGEDLADIGQSLEAHRTGHTLDLLAGL